MVSGGNDKLSPLSSDVKLALKVTVAVPRDELSVSDSFNNLQPTMGRSIKVSKVRDLKKIIPKSPRVMSNRSCLVLVWDVFGLFWENLKLPEHPWPFVAGGGLDLNVAKFLSKNNILEI